MKGLVWHRLIRDIREGHTHLMGIGRVIIPQMHLVVDGDIVAGIVLRPIHAGPDAVAALAEMSHLAAARSADEIVAVWEACDLSVACGGHIPAGPRRELNVLTATPGRHVLFQYPYDEDMLPGRSSDGLLRARPRWRLPSLGIPDADLPPPIAAMVKSCWRPLDANAPDLLHHTVVYLLSQGYRIQLVPAA